MTSAEYRKIVAMIIRNVLHKEYPGLKLRKFHKAGETNCKDAASIAAIAVHARMYGANVDGVDSPIWRDRPYGNKSTSASPNLPDVDASELLKAKE